MSIPRRISTSLKLNWYQHDLDSYPWLKAITRYYSLDKKLGEGAFGTAYAGYPFPSLNARKPFANAPKIVVKLPKIDLRGYPAKENRRRLDYIREKNYKEFLYLRQRLRGCVHANPILDLAVLQDDELGELELPVTIQLYLDHSISLDRWLVRANLGPALDTSTCTLDSGRWEGISDRAKWIAVALPVARALREIHLRRARHGDVHPGNVFLTLEKPYIATLIDFGDGFIATPDLNWRERNPRPNLAPERLGPRFPLNEQIDVYSFGMLLLYLATGNTPDFITDFQPGLHRARIDRLVRSINPSLIREEPRIVDLIARSTARDPADRPRMIDICDDLWSISHNAGSESRLQRASSVDTLKRLTAEMTMGVESHGAVLASLLDHQIRELAHIFDGLKTEMVELYGTREQMLRVMISLLEHLALGDSWTTVTTLAVWQRNALGLNGSYASANVRAIRRKAAIRRVFLVSVAEIGLDFAQKITSKLKHSSEQSLQRLAKLFEAAIADYPSKRAAEHYAVPTPEFVYWHRKRFLSVLEFLDDQIRTSLHPSYFATDPTISIERSTGMYVGICPVATLDDVGAIREDNPVSLMHIARETDDARRWLLVATELRGRNEKWGRTESRDGFDRPHLLGVRVYKSVMGGAGGRPDDRIQYFEALLNQHSAGIASVTKRLLELVCEADIETSSEPQ